MSKVEFPLEALRVFKSHLIFWQSRFKLNCQNSCWQKLSIWQRFLFFVSYTILRHSQGTRSPCRINGNNFKCAKPKPVLTPCLSSWWICHSRYTWTSAPSASGSQRRRPSLRHPPSASEAWAASSRDTWVASQAARGPLQTRPCTQSSRCRRRACQSSACTVIPAIVKKVTARARNSG